MTDASDAWVGFLYGVNIPGRVWLKPEHGETRLRENSAGLAYVKCVGDADNLFIEVMGQTEDTLASRLEALLGVKGAVVISLDRLRSVYATARARLVARGLPGKAPFVMSQDGAEWEFGLVFSSIDLPADATIPAAKNARALEVIERRALLAQRRRVTDAGRRIMWGRHGDRAATHPSWPPGEMDRMPDFAGPRQAPADHYGGRLPRTRTTHSVNGCNRGRGKRRVSSSYCAGL